MSEIFIDREGMVGQMAKMLPVLDDLDAAAADWPTAAEGGIASAMIGFIAAAAAEAAWAVADNQRALIAVATDVLKDMELTEAQIGQELWDLNEEISSS